MLREWCTEKNASSCVPSHIYESYESYASYVSYVSCVSYVCLMCLVSFAPWSNVSEFPKNIYEHKNIRTQKRR